MTGNVVPLIAPTQDLADQNAALSQRIVRQGIMLADQNIELRGMTRTIRRLNDRLADAARRELVAYLVGLGFGVAACGLVYAIESYSLARWLDRALTALGWVAS